MNNEVTKVIDNVTQVSVAEHFIAEIYYYCTPPFVHAVIFTIII